MKLASLVVDGRPALAVEGPGSVLLDAGAVLGHPTLEMDEMIAEAPALLPRLAARLAEADLTRHTVEPGTVRWRAPSPRPSKILGVAINNRRIQEWSFRRFEEPAYFLTPPSALVGHGEPIVVRPDYGLTHPEPELAAVIGRRVCDIAPEEALDAVFGFSVFNDVTSPSLKARDSIELDPPASIEPDITWRRLRGQDDRALYYTYHARSKGCDTFAPMGPWLVTRDEIADPNALAVRGWLADVPVLTDSTANLTFRVEEVISHASRYMTLEAGDVVHFGTAAQTSDPARFPSLWSIDISRHDGPVSIEIEGIGRLDNPVARRAP